MKKGKLGFRILLLTLILLVVVFVRLIQYAYETDPPGRQRTLGEVFGMAAQGQIVSATFRDEDAQVIGRLCTVPVTAPAPSTPAPPVGAPPAVPTAPLPAPPQPAERCPGEVQRFWATYPASDVSTQNLIEDLSPAAEVEVDKQTNKGIAKLLVSFVLPLMMLANLFGLIFLARTGESSITDIVGFGKIGRKRQRKKRSETGISFSNVGGAEAAVVELKEVTDYLTDPKKFEAYGASAPKGVLLFGPPGCGKTLLARAVAGESQVPFFSMSGAEFVESLVGVGAARVRDLFAQVRAVAPAIVFIDEIDAVGRKREGEGATGGEREQTVNQLLVEMDGFDVAQGIVVMGATNRPDILDQALLRPGRFDRHITLEPPDIHGRQEILELHSKGKPIGPDVSFEDLARHTPGFTGADLANVINEGALLAIREGQGAEVSQSHLSEAIQRVLHGPQRRGRLMTAEEQKRIAYHESAHAIVAAALGYRSEAARVSVVARGRGLGEATVVEDKERVLLTKTELGNHMVIGVAGIAAEEMMFGESSTTSSTDMKRVNEIARHMVGEYGMSAELGRLQLLVSNDGFLGEDSVMTTMSGATMQLFEQEAKNLIADSEMKASRILETYSGALNEMAAALEEQETLEGSALERLLAGVRPETALFAESMGSDGKPGGGRRRSTRPADPAT